MQASAGHQRALAAAQINALQGHVRQPRMPMALSQGQEQPLGLDAAAVPQQQADELIALWLEFEAGETNEAKFAKAMDRLEPLLQNSSNNGGTWREFDVDYSTVYDKKKAIGEGSTSLWDYAQSVLDDCVAKGVLKKKDEGLN